MSKHIQLPPIEPFSDDLLDDEKALAVKVLEEAAETFGAWQEDKGEHAVLYECMDVIQELVNFASSVTGLMPDDVSRLLADSYGAVHRANEERGRYAHE